MNLILFFILLGVLLLLVIGYNIIIQSRERIEHDKRIEAQKLNAIIDETDQLLAQINTIPFSKDLLICLQTRSLIAMKGLALLNPKKTDITEKTAALQAQIEHATQHFVGQELSHFTPPDNDKQALILLKLIRRLRAVIRAEHGYGRQETRIFIAENQRLERLQLMINIDNLYKRAREALTANQWSNAKQLLTKGLNALAKYEDDYAEKMTARMIADIEEINRHQNDAKHKLDTQSKQKESDDLDALFQPKKKW
ncbi:MAG: hypothetical protein ACRC53_03195 [Plesiomonas sp.]|uniref:hypothetical protein n=1 Tax=Plesiomonas sp. TaxID=2486279 RepID=UPI003F347948